MDAIDTMTKPYLVIWVIYDHPRDYPNNFVARAHRVRGGEIIDTAICIVSPSYGELIAHLPDGLVNIGRYPEDDPVIKEYWV